MKFFFGDGLTWDDVFDWHDGIVMQNRETPLPSPQGGEANTLQTKIALETQLTHQHRKETDFIPSPLGEGHMDTPIAQVHQGEVPCSSPPHSLSLPRPVIAHTSLSNFYATVPLLHYNVSVVESSYIKI